jgi:membrane-bound lytic murein transglycosylase D
MLPALLILAGCASGPRAAEAPPAAVGLGRPAHAADVDALLVAAEGDPESIVAGALQACESAEALWEQGDIDGALATLDLAYELLLQIPDDPALIQQKEDLRHLVSRRIVEIYRSRLNTAAEPSSPIPMEMNARIEREIERFQGPARKFFLESYARSGEYRPMIVRMLREAGLPEELSWLPLVESGFKTRALSHARALGMWQFISSTGSRYGLERTDWVDERMDPEKATAAAIRYLTDLHRMSGDWMTALAAYNCGEHRVMSLIRRQKNGYLDRFWDIYDDLPRETASYVPRFLATVQIVRNPEKYGFELPEPSPPAAFDTVSIDRHVRLDDLDRALGVETRTLLSLNPELRRGATPGHAYSLKVPKGAATSFEGKLAAVPAYVPPPEVSYGYHRVRRGETLSSIARRNGTSVNAIVKANHLRSRNRIRVGQRLKIPQRGGVAAADAGAVAATNVRHTVRRGDSLWRLASHYGTTVDRIRRDNGLRSDRLVVGQRLTIRRGEEASNSYTVRRGDTISGIAVAQNVPVDSLLRSNGLSASSKIYPGQVLRFPD